jgi:hypothetical protein
VLLPTFMGLLCRIASLVLTRPISKRRVKPRSIMIFSVAKPVASISSPARARGETRSVRGRGFESGHSSNEMYGREANRDFKLDSLVDTAHVPRDLSISTVV